MKKLTPVTYSTGYSIKEGFLDGARVFVLAVIPVIVVGLESGGVDWRIVGVAGAIALLKGVEKFLHKSQSRLHLPF